MKTKNRIEMAIEMQMSKRSACFYTVLNVKYSVCPMESLVLPQLKS